MTTQADELLEFALTKKKKPGKPCPVCSLPERAVIDAARNKAKRGQMGGKMVRRYLIEKCGYTDKTAPPLGSIERHFARGHHRET